MPTQVDNGRAFEFAIAKEIAKWISATTHSKLIRDSAFKRCEKCYTLVDASERKRFDKAASLPLDTLSRLEPAMLNAKSEDDVLFIRLCRDSEGQIGDVRDVILFRKNRSGGISWEIGISAKNNNDAAKHSRISEDIHFGEKWLGMDTSDEYIASLHAVFNWVRARKSEGVVTWRELGDAKETDVYVPLLEAFMREMKRLFCENQTLAAQNLIMYLIGRRPFYKLIKNDRDNTSILKVFNFVPGLGKPYNAVRPECKPQAIPLPTRCVELAFLDGGQRNTVSLIMDKGWQVDFRIHSASTKIEQSLKFDVTLEGNPPILFTQRLF